MTGLWQVSGRSDLPWSEAIRLDLYYVDNWSMIQDLDDPGPHPRRRARLQRRVLRLSSSVQGTRTLRGRRKVERARD